MLVEIIRLKKILSRVTTSSRKLFAGRCSGPLLSWAISQNWLKMESMEFSGI
jgi:hypothetical protein